MTSLIRAGFIGSGGYGAQRRRFVRETGRFQIVAGVDVSDEAAARALAEESGAFCVEKSAEALVGRDDVDVVFICTPPHLHLEQGLLAAGAGKHVFIEKPLGHDLNDARKLVEECGRRGLMLGLGFSTRLQAGARLCKEYIDAGK